LEVQDRLVGQAKKWKLCAWFAVIKLLGDTTEFLVVMDVEDSLKGASEGLDHLLNLIRILVKWIYLNRNLDYVCKESNQCVVDVSRRNQCQACRFRRCLEVNMKRDGIGGILPSIFIHFGRKRSFNKKNLYLHNPYVEKSDQKSL